MKKIVLSQVRGLRGCFLPLLLIALTGVSMAQPAIGRGRENKFVSPEAMAGACYVGQQAKLDAWVLRGRKDRLELAMIDANMVPQFEAELPDTKEMTCLAATMDPEQANILVFGAPNKHQTVVGAFRVKMDKYEVIGGRMDTLLRFDYGKKDECMVWGGQSPSGHFVGVLSVIKYKETGLYRTMATMYDEKLTKLWEQEVPLGSLSQLRVSDLGHFVTFGIEEEGEESIFVFNTISSRDHHTFRTKAKCDGVRMAELVGVADQQALVIGTYGVAGSKKMKKMTGGVLALSFDLQSGEPTAFTLRAFENEDINIFRNEKTKKKQKKLIVENVDMLHAVQTSYGAAAIFSLQYRLTYQNASGVEQNDYCSTGLHCMAMDRNGQIKWVRNLRRNMVQSDDYLMMDASLIEANGRTCVLTVEHKKSPDSYDIAKPAKQNTIGSEGKLVYYGINAEGEVQKLWLEKNTKYGIIRTIQHEDGNLMIYEGRKDLTRAVDLRFTY